MGTCYSTQSRSSADKQAYSIVPSSMPHQSQAPPTNKQAGVKATFGFAKPYGGRYGLKTQTKSSDSSQGSQCAADDNDNQKPAKKTSQQETKSKFGFVAKTNGRVKNGDSNSNISVQSVDSTASNDSRSSRKLKQGSKPDKSSQKTKVVSKNAPSFEPSFATSWRMIDDSSRSTSKDRSLSSANTTPQHKASVKTENGATIVDEDIINANVPVCESSAKPENVNKTEKVNSDNDVKKDSKTASKLPAMSSRLPLNRLRAPFSKATSSNGSTQKQEKNSKTGPPPKKTSSVERKGSNTSNKSSNESLSKKQNGKQTEQKTQKKNGSYSNTSSRAIGPSFLRRGFFSKQKSLPDKSSQKGRSEERLETEGVAKSPPTKSKSETTDLKKCTDIEVDFESTVLTPEEDDRLFLERVEKIHGRFKEDDDKTPIAAPAVVSKPIPIGSKVEKAPIAMIDSIETTSVGSFNSDDLMLDVNIDEALDDPLSPTTPTADNQKYHRPRSRERSYSKDSLDNFSTGAPSSSHRKPPLVRRNTDSIGRRQVRTSSTSESKEPLLELAALMGETNAIPRRHGRLHSASRPNSFPGPRKAQSLDSPNDPPVPPTSHILKPPRTAPSVGDDEVIDMDGYTYRQIMQDATSLKTMLLKLKRNLQDEELGSPISAHPHYGSLSKSGYRLSSSLSIGSQPGTPRDDSFKFNFTGNENNNPVIQDVMKENAELREQVRLMQHQIEEQEKTIHLLQQQMTKYEVGYVGPEGRSFAHTASQTDKPHFAVPKSKFEHNGSDQPPTQRSDPFSPHNVRYRTELSTNDNNGQSFLGTEEMSQSDDSGIQVNTKKDPNSRQKRNKVSFERIRNMGSAPSSVESANESEILLTNGSPDTSGDTNGNSSDVLTDSSTASSVIEGNGSWKKGSSKDEGDGSWKRTSVREMCNQMERQLSLNSSQISENSYSEVSYSEVSQKKPHNISDNKQCDSNREKNKLNTTFSVVHDKDFENINNNPETIITEETDTSKDTKKAGPPTKPKPSNTSQLPRPAGGIPRPKSAQGDAPAVRPTRLPPFGQQQKAARYTWSSGRQKGK